MQKQLTEIILLLFYFLPHLYKIDFTVNFFFFSFSGNLTITVRGPPFFRLDLYLWARIVLNGRSMWWIMSALMSPELFCGGWDARIMHVSSQMFHSYFSYLWPLTVIGASSPVEGERQWVVWWWLLREGLTALELLRLINKHTVFEDDSESWKKFPIIVDYNNG